MPKITQNLRLSLLLWGAGMSGVVAISILVLPQLLSLLPEKLGREAPAAPIWVLCLASVVQSGALLALAVWAGSTLAPRIGFSSPFFEAIAARRPALPMLRPQLLPGMVGGAFGGLLLVCFGTFPPDELRAAQKVLDLPLIARVLYGGITEEILLRWGLLTLLVWLPWRFWQARGASPQKSLVWLAIVVSAIAFGAGHLPAAGWLVGALTPTIVVWVIGANALFGVLAGYLFWRRGLESAMTAHAVAHIVGFAFLR
jgi:membrane protease YdiL (CAAX protease family)